jgi:hypothetical protein
MNFKAFEREFYELKNLPWNIKIKEKFNECLKTNEITPNWFQ